MITSNSARITGTGVFLPPAVYPNSYFEERLATSDEWIFTRTGIRERRFADSTTYPSTMGAAAAREALADAAVDISAVDFILVATMSGDYPSPSTAALIQAQLGSAAPAMDVQAACTGFVYALATAKAYVEAGMARCILVIATEKMSSLLDYQDRTTCVLFGDGAAAAVVAKDGPGMYIGTPSLGCDGGSAELVIISGGGARHPTSVETLASGSHYFRMQGKELFKQATRQAATSVMAALTAAGLTVADIEWLVPHQANQRLMEMIAKQLGMSPEKVYSVVASYGNTSAAGIGIALHELLKNHPLHAGQSIVLNAFGGGLTWGSIILTYLTE